MVDRGGTPRRPENLGEGRSSDRQPGCFGFDLLRINNRRSQERARAAQMQQDAAQMQQDAADIAVKIARQNLDPEEAINNLCRELNKKNEKYQDKDKKDNSIYDCQIRLGVFTFFEEILKNKSQNEAIGIFNEYRGEIGCNAHILHTPGDETFVFRNGNYIMDDCLRCTEGFSNGIHRKDISDRADNPQIYAKINEIRKLLGKDILNYDLTPQEWETLRQN